MYWGVYLAIILYVGALALIYVLIDKEVSLDGEE